MKVLHINTKDVGGSGMAAVRLHNGLLNLGVSSHMLVARSENEVIERSVFEPAKKSFFYKFSRERQILKQQRKTLSGLPRDYEMFSLSRTPLDITQDPRYKSADIIHLHWISNFVNYTSFFKSNKKPIVWTLHDMNPFSGGFHYEEDYQRNKEVFRELDSSVRQEKQMAYKHSAPLHIVTPSEWLRGISKNSALLGRFPHLHIPNGLDHDTFKPMDRNLAREALNIKSGKKVLVFISESLKNRRKGFDLLKEALSEVKNEDLLICAVGETGGILDGRPDISSLGRINNEEQMALVYNAADAFVMPSREDNLPNVMIEAMACGTPVISFPVGGIAQVIETGFNGILSTEVTVEALRRSIHDFLEDKYVFDRAGIRDFSLKHFRVEEQAKKFLELYQSIV